MEVNKESFSIEIMNDFPNLLRHSIAKAGLSQAEFGRRVNLTGALINMICQRKATPPLDGIAKWVEVLELSDADGEEFITSAMEAHAPKAFRERVQRTAILTYPPEYLEATAQAMRAGTLPRPHAVLPSINSVNRAATPAATYDGGRPMLPAGTVRAGTADVSSQIEQRELRWPPGTQYVAIEGDSGGDVLWQGQLAVIGPASLRPRPGDIAAIHFMTGKLAGKSVIKWISQAKTKGFMQLDSRNPLVPALLIPDDDWRAAEKRLVIGAVFRPEVMK